MDSSIRERRKIPRSESVSAYRQKHWHQVFKTTACIFHLRWRYDTCFTSFLMIYPTPKGGLSWQKHSRILSTGCNIVYLSVYWMATCSIKWWTESIKSSH